MKTHLFYTFLTIFVVTTGVTLAGVTGLITVKDGYLTGLVTAFLIESAGATIALFRGAEFFRHDGGRKEGAAITERELEKTRADLAEAQSRIAEVQVLLDAANGEARQHREALEKLTELRLRVLSVLGARSADARGIANDLRIAHDSNDFARLQAVLGQLEKEGEIERDRMMPDGYFQRIRRTQKTD